MQKKLTPRQEECLQFIRNFKDENGKAPTRKEIADHFTYASTSPAQALVAALAKAGYITIDKSQARSIRIKGSSENEKLPIHNLHNGNGSGGNTSTAAPDATVQRVKQLFTERVDFLVQMNDDSMQDLGIHKDDLVAMRQASRPKNGDVVFAHINDLAVVRIYYATRNSEVTLIPAAKGQHRSNVKHDRDSFRVDGVCIGVVRRHIGTAGIDYLERRSSTRRPR